MAMTQTPIEDYANFDLFKRIKDKRDPAKMRLRRKANHWEAAVTG